MASRLLGANDKIFDFAIGSPQSGLENSKSFQPIPKEVVTMTDYEILAIVLLVITLAFTIHISNHHK